MAQQEINITDHITDASGLEIRAVYDKLNGRITVKDLQGRDLALEGMTLQQYNDLLTSLQLVSTKAALEFA